MKSAIQLFAALRGKLIVSCQAFDHSPFRHSECMARFAQAAVEGGAAGIRANRPEDIRAIRQVVRVPVLGIWKAQQDDGEILITPSFEAAQQVVEAGACMVAMDCTLRGQKYGAFERLRRVREELGVPVLADIATVEEAVQAAQAGADAVLSTLRGYTAETRHVQAFEPSFIAELARAVSVPVFAEGHIQTPAEARAALEAGAFAVIVGTAITRPELITESFVAALKGWRCGTESPRTFIGIDLGGTNTKSGLVTSRGELLWQSVIPTPWREGREALLEHLEHSAARCRREAQNRGLEPDAIGVATAGWVDPACGEVVYATENLPGWTGANPAEHLRKALGLPVAIENDANALAVAEKEFGAAGDATDFVCITLGTGVGGGCYVGGRLNRGRHFFANALGHIPVVPGGMPCTCGRSGCLEVYANAAALMRYATAGDFASCEAIIAAAQAGDSAAQGAVATLAHYLAAGCASIVQVLDPELLILGGGLAQNNPLLLSALKEELAKRVTAWPQRRLRVQASALGYEAGVLGAAAVAAQAIATSGAVDRQSIPNGILAGAG
ncbi:MAG TPA: putative N-acetylmannosamine-6-phosphate 2-epimerase [Terriglobia bacterium]|nr:putative N-acetylmannosamine-6-phosphate 2-epimerase [Terriglobia bacterium]